MTKNAVALGDIAEIVMGQSPPGSSYNRARLGEPLLNGPAEFQGRHPIAVQWTTEPTRFSSRGDILFCVRGATTGRKCWSDQRYAIGRGLAAIRGRSSHCDTQFLWFLLDVVTERLLKRAAGSTFANLPGEALLSFRVDLPPLPEQKRIAGRLTEQLAAVERARGAAQSSLAAAESLPAAYLRQVFEGPEASGWETVRFDRTCDLLPSKSISTEGDTVVRAITTACLSERGFLPAGIKTGRMRGADVADCLVRRGEVLIARSNTPELVGRVAMYDGDPPGVVATDLTIRIWPRENMHADYLTAFLSYLFQTGYWKAKAGGASGTMKKITREQLLAQELRVPPGCTSGAPERSLADQRRIAADLAARLAGAERLAEGIRAELAAIEALPAALLREAFGGG